MIEKTYHDLYDEYVERYNGEPKHDFGHFIRVMSSLEHHHELIRPRIIFWHGIENKLWK